MFRLIFLSVCVAFTLAENADIRFGNWAKEFMIRFENNNHREHVFANWLVNDKHIESVNAQNLTYTLGHNHLSGMNQDEYKNYLGYSQENVLGRSFDDSKVAEVKCLYSCVKSYDESNKLGTVKCVKDCLAMNKDMKSTPDSVNWVEKGAVTPVKDQGQCGSCWSFSTTGALEGAYFLKTGDLVAFSEQELVDCDNLKNGGRDHGCNGGLMDNAFSWIEKHDGLCTEEEYPYTSGKSKSAGSCQSCDPVSDSKIVNFKDVSKNSDDAMMEALAQQPISIAIQADQKDFQLYKSGVFTGSCGTKLDHGVLAVGYGSEDGVDYYLVKNSWSSTWGDNGYIRLGRGDDFNKGAGQCGMLMQASYPLL